MTHWNNAPDIMSFARAYPRAISAGHGIMVSKDVKEAMDSSSPRTSGCTPTPTRGIRPRCAVGLKNVEIMEREGTGALTAASARAPCCKALHAAFDSHPNVGDIRSGKGLLAAVELVEDKATKKSYGADQKIGERLMQEMSKRGVITRARMENIFFSPALVITEEQLDRMVSVTQEAVKAVTGK
jgi:adenosylmethionine-8-amino-7-oxononanoate aminotransferase